MKWAGKRRLIRIFSIACILPLLTNSCDTFKKGGVYTSISGAYSCQESSVYSGYRKYLIEIDKVNNQENLYIISNFHNLGDVEFLYTTLKNDSLFIENQNISGYFISGKAIVNDDYNRIEVVYTTDDGSNEQDYFAVYSR